MFKDLLKNKSKIPGLSSRIKKTDHVIDWGKYEKLK